MKASASPTQPATVSPQMVNPNNYHSNQYIVETNPDITAHLIPPTPPPRRTITRLGCITLNESPKNGSIDDSDGAGSVITTSTTSTNDVFKSSGKRHDDKLKLIENVKGKRNFEKSRMSGSTSSLRIRRVASGLRLAQSQAMAVAGFLPDDMEMNQFDGKRYLNAPCIAFGRSLSIGANASGTVGDSNIGQLSQRASFHGRGQK